MKILILTLTVLVLSSSAILDIVSNNTLKDLSFSIAYNVLDNKHINGVEVVFTDSSISFAGCNRNWANYTIKATGQFAITSSWGSTQMFCLIDYDNQIRRLFSNTTKVKKESLTVKLDFLKGAQLLLILKPNIRLQPQNPFSDKTFIIESTILGIDQIIGTQISFTDIKIFFRKCNLNSAFYSLDADNNFSIDSLWASTKIRCPKNYDSSITHLFSSSVRYTLRFDGGIILYDQTEEILQLAPKEEDVIPRSGIESLSITPSISGVGSLPVSPPISLLGKEFVVAQAALKNTTIIGIAGKFTKTTLSFQGCNQNFVPYSVRGNNVFNVKVEEWVWTQVFCLIDNDSSLRELFSKSRSFQASPNGSVSFFDEKSALTLRISLKQPLKGSFSILYNSLNISKINGVKINFNNGSVGFKQCNTNMGKYEAGLDFSFKIVGSWVGTLIFCFDNDYDKQIKQLLESSVRFSITKDNHFTFFDKSSRKVLQLTPS